MTLMATLSPGQSTRRQLIMEIAHCRSGHIEHRGFAMNSINVIAPYKHHGMWVFDDPRVGLLQEPFVSGADTMIDRVVADLPDAELGFTLVFSATPFPGHQYRLDWRRAAATGITPSNWAWRAGSARRSCATSPSRQKSCTCRSGRIPAGNPTNTVPAATTAAACAIPT